VPDWHKRSRDGWATQWACRIIAPRTDALARIPAQQLADYPIDHQSIQHRQIALSHVSGARGL
jgi:hypothetical protein